MISGHNFIGFEKKATGEKKLYAFSSLLKNNLPGEFIAATENEIHEEIEKATVAFETYRQTIRDVKAGKVKDSIYYFQYALYAGGINILDRGVKLTRDFLPNFLPELDRFGIILKEVGNVYLHVNEERYALAVTSLTRLSALLVGK